MIKAKIYLVTIVMARVKLIIVADAKMMITMR